MHKQGSNLFSLQLDFQCLQQCMYLYCISLFCSRNVGATWGVWRSLNMKICTQ